MRHGMTLPKNHLRFGFLGNPPVHSHPEGHLSGKEMWGGVLVPELEREPKASQPVGSLAAGSIWSHKLGIPWIMTNVKDKIMWSIKKPRSIGGILENREGGREPRRNQWKATLVRPPS